ncbi:MAG: hypothetical protein ABSC11_02220 [Smithella sp.]|jgi:hypothetical protein
MHYKNGRKAKAGDQVVCTATGFSGILFNVNAKATSCNGQLAQIVTGTPYVTLNQCLHIDDIAAADVPNIEKE